MQCEFYGPSQAKAEVKLAEWKKANARAISIIAQIIERPSTNSDACVIRVSTKTASNDSRPGRPEAAGRHRKKGAESERPQAYNFLVELGSFHSAFSSSPTAPMMLCPARSALLGRRGKAVGFTHRLAALLCVCRRCLRRTPHVCQHRLQPRPVTPLDPGLSSANPPQPRASPLAHSDF